MRSVNEEYFDKHKSSSNDIELNDVKKHPLYFLLTSFVITDDNVDVCKFLERSFKKLHKSLSSIFKVYKPWRVGISDVDFDMDDYEGMAKRFASYGQGKRTEGFGSKRLLEIFFSWDCDAMSMDFKKFENAIKNVYFAIKDSFTNKCRFNVYVGSADETGDMSTSASIDFMDIDFRKRRIKSLYHEIHELGDEDDKYDGLSKDAHCVELHFSGYASLCNQSPKKVNEFKFGDSLYADIMGNLTSEEETEDIPNVKIGVCVSTNETDEVKKFMSVGFINPLNPEKVSPRPTMIYYGLDDNEKIKKDLDLVDDEVEGMEMMYSEISTCRYGSDFMTGMLPTDKRTYENFHAIPFAVYRHHTIGTTPGQWVIPSLRTLQDIVAYRKNNDVENKTIDSLFYCQINVATCNLTGYSGMFTYVPIKNEFRASSGDNPTRCIPMLLVK